MIEFLKFSLYIAVVAHLLASLFYLWPSFFVCNDQLPFATQEWACVDPAGAALRPDLGSGYRRNDTFSFTLKCAKELREITAQLEMCSVFGCTDNQTAAQKAYVPEFLRSETFLIDNSCLPHSWRAGSFVTKFDKSCTPDASKGETCETEVSVEASSQWSKYTQSLYWSITTMTTIGYGDRGPSIVQEVWFVMFAEIVGLSFFALLLQAINDVNESLGLNEARSKKAKNDIVGFLAHHELPVALSRKVINYVNFSAKSQSDRFVADDDERFETLSPALRRELRVAALRPALTDVALFGHSQALLKEQREAHKLFRSIDKDRSGILDRSELVMLMAKFDMHMEDAALDVAMEEMAPDGSNQVGFAEFFQWLHFRKYGRPVIPRAPSLFMDELAYYLTPKAFSPGDWCIEQGAYGEEFFVVLAGVAKTYWIRPAETEHVLVRTISHHGREPIIALSAALDQPTWEHVRLETSNWAVQADTFLDVAVISRHELLKCLELWEPAPNVGSQAWHDGTHASVELQQTNSIVDEQRQECCGQELLRSIAAFHYNFDEVAVAPVFHAKGDHKHRERHSERATVKHLEDEVEAMEQRIEQRIASMERNLEAKVAGLAGLLSRR